MNSIHLRHRERGLRSTSFVDSQSEDHPEGSKVALLNASIKQELVKLAELDVIRSSSMSRQRQATAARRHNHKRLENLVNTTIGTADVIALDRADFKGMFGRPQRNASSQTLVADARSIADKAASVVGLFTDNGMSPTFVNDLRSYADSLENSIQLQTECAGERMRANAEMEETIRRLSGLMERLDINLRNRYANDPAKLAAWESAHRLEKAPRSNRDGENNATPPANNTPPAAQQ